MGDDAKLNFEISSKNKKIRIPLPRNQDRSSLDFPLNFIKGIQIFHCTNSNYTGVDTFYTYLVIQTYVKDQEGTFALHKHLPDLLKNQKLDDFMNLYRYNNKPIKGTKENEKCILLKLFIPPDSKTGQNKDL